MQTIAAGVTPETEALIRAVIEKGAMNATDLRKAGYNVAQGLAGYLLEAPAKNLFPFNVPLIKRIPRTAAPVGSQAANWRAVTAINAAKSWASVAEGIRNAFLVTNTKNYLAAFKTIGHDDYITDEAFRQAKSFEDLLSTRAVRFLIAAKLSEELMHLGGNARALGTLSTIPQPAGVAQAASSGAGIPNATYNAKVSAITLQGFRQGAVGALIGPPVGADAAGETAPGAASAGVATGGTGKSIVWTWAAVPGAVAYNLYVQSGGAGAFIYQGTFTINKIEMLTYSSTNLTQPNATDLSANQLDYDGILAQIELSQVDGSAQPAALFKDQGGAKLTSDGSSGIVEFDAILQAIFTNFELSPTLIITSVPDAVGITRLITGTSGPSMRIYLNDGQKDIVGGIYANQYLNRFTAGLEAGQPRAIPLLAHPRLPQGTVLFFCEELPYPINEVPNVWEFQTLQEWLMEEFARVQRRREYGVYEIGVLKGYFNVAQAAIVCMAQS